LIFLYPNWFFFQNDPQHNGKVLEHRIKVASFNVVRHKTFK
jgi:hypothetical protein